MNNVATNFEITHEDAVVLVDAIRVANGDGTPNMQQMELGIRLVEHFDIDDPFFKADYEAAVAQQERFQRLGTPNHADAPASQTAWEAVALRNLNQCLGIE